MKSLAGKISKKWNKLREKLEEKYSGRTKERVLIPVNNENDWLDQIKHSKKTF